MNMLKFLTTLFFVFSFVLISADIDQQKFNQANKNFKNQPRIHNNIDLQIPDWLKTKADNSFHDYIETNHNNNSRDIIDVKVNGDDQTIIAQGDDIVITIFFSDNCSEAFIEIWADMNNNGTWEENVDVPIPEYQDTIQDNDPNDEDPMDGIYQLTIYGDEEGPLVVSNLGLLFLAEDNGGIDSAFAFIEPVITSYSISGNVIPSETNLVVMAINEDDDTFMAATGNTGSYQNYFPEAGVYSLMAFDPLGILNGMFSTTFYSDISVSNHLTGYDFMFEPGNSTIEGTITDELGNPLEGITVYVYEDGPTSVWDQTNSNGFYSITVIEGEWEVELEDDDLIPDYMNPDQVEIYVEDGGVEIVDFVVYSTDAPIEGTVYLDGIPVSGFNVYAYSLDFGYSFAQSSGDGLYEIAVSSEANMAGGYEVSVSIDDFPGLYVDEYYSNIMSGSNGIDFHIHTATGGIEGFIYDSVALEPAEDCWITVFNGTNYYFAGTDDTGYYVLYIPNGTYEVWARGDNYAQEYLEEIVINNNFVIQDFYLDPIVTEGTLEGFVFEEGTTNPISSVDIYIYNNIFWSSTTTDDFGYYYIDLPNGNYFLDAMHPEYYTEYQSNIIINNDVVQLDIEMEPLIFDGTLHGTVYEEGTTIPISFAQIHVYDQFYGVIIWSNENGIYSVDLPNGIYDLECWKYGYQDTYLEDIVINDNIIELDIYMIPDVGVDFILESRINLISNYPNPFNPNTTISFNLNTESTENTELVIYNLKGQKVRQLFSDQLSTGQHSVLWNGDDEFGKPVSSGIYLYKLKSGNFQKTRKMILMK